MFSSVRDAPISGVRRLTIAGIAGASLLIGLGACGGDDDDSSDTTAAAAETTTAPATTAAAAATTAAPAGGADVDAFCQAELEAEAAVNSEDPAAAGPAFEALLAVTPDEIKPNVEAVIAAAGSGDTDGPEFSENYAAMIGFVKDNCGFADLDVSSTEYEFGGVPPTLDAGPVVITLTNNGEEFHELALVRVNDDTTETVEELLALPEEEARQKTTDAGGAFAAPGVTSYASTNLEPGHYAAVCFLPVGATPENIEALEAGTMEGGPPHFTEGMVTEFDVE